MHDGEHDLGCVVGGRVVCIRASGAAVPGF